MLQLCSKNYSGSYVIRVKTKLKKLQDLSSPTPQPTNFSPVLSPYFPQDKLASYCFWNYAGTLPPPGFCTCSSFFLTRLSLRQQHGSFFLHEHFASQKGTRLFYLNMQSPKPLYLALVSFHRAYFLLSYYFRLFSMFIAGFLLLEWKLHGSRNFCQFSSPVPPVPVKQPGKQFVHNRYVFSEYTKVWGFVQ